MSFSADMCISADKNIHQSSVLHKEQKVRDHLTNSSMIRHKKSGLIPIMQEQHKRIKKVIHMKQKRSFRQIKAYKYEITIILMQMDLESSAQQQVEGGPFDKVIDIYEQYMRQVKEVNMPNPFQLDEEQFLVKANTQQKIFLKQYRQLNHHEKENGKPMQNQQSDQINQELRLLQEFQHKCFLRSLKEQCDKKRLHIPSIKDSLFYHEYFMEKYDINFAKARRLQKEVTNLILLNSFQFKAMAINDQQLDQHEKRLKEDLTNFYEKEISNVKKYFPEDYEHIFALSTARGPMSIKKRKQNGQR